MKRLLQMGARYLVHYERGEAPLESPPDTMREYSISHSQRRLFIQGRRFFTSPLFISRQIGR